MTKAKRSTSSVKRFAFFYRNWMFQNEGLEDVRKLRDIKKIKHY